MTKVIKILLIILVAGFIPNAWGQTTVITSSQRPNTVPMTKEELSMRVKEAYTKRTDFDSIAADVDQRGIDFAVEDNLINQVRFMRAAIVSNALYRADDRRKALIAKPAHSESLDAVPEQAKKEFAALPFIEQSRVIALAYVNNLPNFIVREQIQRYETPLVGTTWKLGDYLEMGVRYSAEHGEEIKLRLENGRTSTKTMDQLGGLTSTGQFAGQLSLLFNPDSRTAFNEIGKIDFYGQPCLIYSYQVATKNSRQVLKIGDAQVITGYQGRLYIQRDTKQVLRMEQESIDIPASFPISKAISIVEFGWVSIANKDFLLPVSAQVALTSKIDHQTLLNCITFGNYSKFDTDIKIVDE